MEVGCQCDQITAGKLQSGLNWVKFVPCSCWMTPYQEVHEDLTCSLVNRFYLDTAQHSSNSNHSLFFSRHNQAWKVGKYCKLFSYFNIAKHKPHPRSLVWNWINSFESVVIHAQYAEQDLNKRWKARPKTPTTSKVIPYGTRIPLVWNPTNLGIS